MFRKLLLVLALFVVSLASLTFNIAIHEAGHYAVAKYFDLKPKIGFQEGASFIWNKEPIAYTSYVGGTKAQDLLISATGPLANLMVFLLSALAFKRNKNFYFQLLFLAVSVTALLSFTSNLIPANGSDGELLLSLL